MATTPARAPRPGTRRDAPGCGGFVAAAVVLVVVWCAIIVAVAQWRGCAS